MILKIIVKMNKHYTELTLSLILLQKKKPTTTITTNLPDPDKSKLKTVCLNKSWLINQAAPRKLSLRAGSPAGHVPPLDTQVIQTIWPF